MKTDLDHLPANKQRELERVKAIIFEEFEDALALGTMSWKKKGRIDKIILYGSYARGGWVDEPHTAKGYRSDFDLLIIVNDKRLTERVDYWLKLEDRLTRELAIDKTLHTPVNFIVHTIQEVNDGLAHGRYFFMDVAKDGIALYEYDDKELHKPKPKIPCAAPVINAVLPASFVPILPSPPSKLPAIRPARRKKSPGSEAIADGQAIFGRTTGIAHDGVIGLDRVRPVIFVEDVVSPDRS